MQTCTWLNKSIPFHKLNYVGNKDGMHKILTVDPVRALEGKAYHLPDITTTKDSSTDVCEIANNQTYDLTPKQHAQLYEVL